MLTGVEVVRKGRVEPLIRAHADLTSAAVGWKGIALESHSIQACLVPRHEHIENFLLVILSGSAKYEVLTSGRTLEFPATPGTIFLLPRGTVDEIRWRGPTQRITVAINERLLINAIDETSHERDVELTEHWNLSDPHILAVLHAMRTDLSAGSPAGRLYGETLADALAVYVIRRYAVRRYSPLPIRGGLSSYRLRRVLEYIDDNLASDVGLADLSSIVGMSPHYFAESFRKSTGYAPHQFVLMQRIERAKQNLGDPMRSVLEAGLEAGFQNASHFARVFRRLVGTSPSRYRSER
jgi:AraC family transcriptional regulator